MKIRMGLIACAVLLSACQHAPLTTAASAQTGASQTVMLPGNIPLEMVWIPAGCFMMGCYPNEQDAYPDEAPQHPVTLSRGFWMGKYEVTQQQWRAIMQTAPWTGQKFVADIPQSPAVCISWQQTQEFIEKLNRYTGDTFRLPSEAEWEYACRAGTTTRFYWGDDLAFRGIDDQAWWRRTALNTDQKFARRVGSKLPNPWGLHDMGGNVYEWCHDWYAPYPDGPQTDYAGSENGKKKVNRGGSWITIGGCCRSARRGYDIPSAAYDDLGFRLLLFDIKGTTP